MSDHSKPLAFGRVGNLSGVPLVNTDRLIYQMADAPAGGVIRLRFVAEFGFLSWLICWFTHSRYSHVGTILDNGDELGARFFANKSYNGKRGLQRRPGDYARFRRVLTIRVEVSAEQARSYHRALLREAGDRYDWRAILAYVTGRRVAGFRPHQFNCSVVTGWLLIVAGVLHRPRVAKRGMTPGDVLLAISAAYPVIVEEERG